MIGIDIESYIDLFDEEHYDVGQLLDIAWLSKYMKTDEKHYQPKKETAPKTISNEVKEEPKDEATAIPPKSEEYSSSNVEVESEENVSLSLNNNQNSSPYINIAHQGYFENINYLSRYLIDFKEKSFHRRKKIFDETRTVDYKANTGILNPFFLAKKQKKYNLYLFVDSGQSMDIWEEMTTVYGKLLTNSGVFKSVQIIYLNTNEEKVEFFRDKKQKNSFSSREITNFYDDKLIFVLTDMLSTSWNNGNALEVIAKLYKTIPLYVVQMLPHRLWKKTRLGQASITTLEAKRAYPTRSDYGSEIDYLLDTLSDKIHRVKFPLVNFELSYLKVMGRTLKAKESNKIDGAVFNLKKLKSDTDEEEISESSPQERVSNFFANASEKAQELAKAFTAVPLNLAIMRMIQTKLINENSNIFIAEVLNSKLLEKKGEFYHYDDEVHQVLFSYLGREKALEIAYRNSDYIQENLNAKFGFKALLAGEVDLEKIDFSENDKVFASISCRILKSLGKEYASLVGCKGTKKVKAITPTSKRFQMGSKKEDKDANDREKPVHEVIIIYDFEIAQTPVTVGEFRVFVEETEYKTEAERDGGTYVWDDEKKDWEVKKDANWKNPYFEQTDDHPVVCVSWNDAQAYIEWINKKTAESYRLPTEAEWEFSCRAGSTTKWHFGDDEKDLEAYAWYDDKGGKCTKPVATKKPNKWDLYDMHGNVWEWCLDDFEDNYNNTPLDGSEHILEKKEYKSLRGGSWLYDSIYSRSANRFRYIPSIRVNYVGFRLLRTLP